MYDNVYDAGDVCLGALAPGWAGCRSRMPSLNEGFSQAWPDRCLVRCSPQSTDHFGAGPHAIDIYGSLQNCLSLSGLAAGFRARARRGLVVSQTEAVGNGAGSIPEDPGGGAVIYVT